MNHSEWNAGMSVRLLAQIIIIQGIAPGDKYPRYDSFDMGDSFSEDTPIGRVTIIDDGHGRIARVLIGSDIEDTVRTDTIAEAFDQLDDYLSGERRSFDLKYSFDGTEFQTSVWKELMNIPYGKTISYAELAARIGKPNACRAVGNANGKNPIPIFIPCHRVVSSDGSIGGYSCGIGVKRKLLEMETGRKWM